MPTPQWWQERLEIESQIRSDFSELQEKLEGLRTEVLNENDADKKQEKQAEFDKMQADLVVMKNKIDELSSLQEEALLAFKAELEAYWEVKQDVYLQTTELLQEKAKISTPTTYELLKDSETCSRLLNIIASHPKEFKDLPWDTAEKKLEYIFEKIRGSIVLFMKNKLWDSYSTEKVINNTIAPAFEWGLMEMLRDQWNETNVGMLQWMDKISFDNFNRLVRWVWDFAKKATWSYNQFSQWMNAVDYLSVHNWVLRNPSKSEVLSNPLKFQEYMNDARFKATGFSPYAVISDNIFKIDESQTFEFGMSLQESQSVLDQIWNIQVVDSPKTTALIAKMLDKPEKFLGKTEKLQKTANGLLEWINSINPVAKMFGVDIFWEISKAPEKRNFWYKILDFVCKLIWITWWLEWIIKRWRLDRMELTDAKNDDISKIFGKYKELAWENEKLTITDENSCKTALSSFKVTSTQSTSSTKWDFLRDSMADNMDVSLVSPAVVQQFLWNGYLKKETIQENRQSKEKITVDASKFTKEDKLLLADKHVANMENYLESNYADLSDFYKNINSTEDVALCITASLYADKDDVIEWVKAKVFLPENYGSVRLDWTVQENLPKFTPWEYPFKDVPPYQWISAYDLRDVKMTPVLDYSELTKPHEWSVTLTGVNITNKWSEYPENGTIWNRNNNPCDISHSNSDIGYISSNTVADGQALAKYDTPVDGIASAMRLLKNKYSNKSVTEVNVGWYQWVYKSTEDIWLSALRIKWITDQCNALWIWPHKMLDFNDPMTLKSFVAQIAVLETGTHIGKELLDQAYDKAFS